MKKLITSISSEKQVLNAILFFLTALSFIIFIYWNTPLNYR